ncbi:MAG: helix-turn-helix transcriptional regulator [Bacteroidales bacterium]|nr:helix-turn-helix transcriptional regulator [Bacteroidales bacterium]
MKYNENYQQTDSYRINAICSHFNLKLNEFAEEIGKEYSTIRNISSGNTPISKFMAKAIVRRYPEISYDWLLTGKGQMLKDTGNVIGNNNKAGGDIVGGNKTALPSDLIEIVKSQQKVIQDLTETNRQQSDQIGQLIKMLSQTNIQNTWTSKTKSNSCLPASPR